MNDEQEIFERLARFSLEDRLIEIANDVTTGRDEFRSLASFFLASLLEVPEPELGTEEDPLWGHWVFTKYVKREPLSEYVERASPPEEVIYLLEGQVDEARYNDLLHEAELIETGEQEFSLSLFSEEEKRLIEESIMARKDERGAGTVIANCEAAVVGKAGKLSFEALIEDGGECFRLLTPYDERDGHFADLTDCLTEPCC